jgi:hypothetical protein
MAIKTDIIIPKGSDVIVQVTLTGSGSIAGQTYLGTLRLGSGGLVNGSCQVSDATGRVIDWALADTDTDALPPGTGYRWDVWRVDDGSEYPVAYGHVKLEQYARGG